MYSTFANCNYSFAILSDAAGCEKKYKMNLHSSRDAQWHLCVRGRWDFFKWLINKFNSINDENFLLFISFLSMNWDSCCVGVSQARFVWVLESGDTIECYHWFIDQGHIVCFFLFRSNCHSIDFRTVRWDGSMRFVDSRRQRWSWAYFECLR